jgi:disulfide bond formation protein DsbB
MKSATALTTLAVGAIFAFAVTAHPSFLNLQILGWVLMLTGITGLIIPRRGRGWLRRSVLVKGSPDFTETATADVRQPIIALGSGESAPTVAEGQVERESIVEYMEK